MSQVNILVVEDDFIIAAHISTLLTETGYAVAETLSKGESVVAFLDNNLVDVILMDINLAGDLDGVETARLVMKKHTVPVIFLTANADATTFDRAKDTYPAGFISKPFKNEDLTRTLELVLNTSHKDQTNVKAESSNSEMLTDRVFVRDKDRMIKLGLDDILYVEAERNYCKITTKEKSYTLSIPLAKFESKISNADLMRIHRSHSVNIKAIDELNDNYVFINGKSLAVSKSYKEELAKKLNLV